MKALSIRNPYARWILCCEKTIEVRSWNTQHRGDLLVCSSASPKIPGQISGYALCVVSLDDVKPLAESDLEAACLDEMPDAPCYGWHLSNVRPVKPFPVKGKLNFYTVDDALIEIVENDVSDEEAMAFYDTYFAPFSYKYKKIGSYFFEGSTGTLVRWRVGQHPLEYRCANDAQWHLTEADSPYEAWYYDGGDSVDLELLDEKDAHRMLDSWGVKKPYGE